MHDTEPRRALSSSGLFVALRSVLNGVFSVYFRFSAGLLLAVLVSMAGVWLEKQTLELRRLISVQYYQTDLLLELLVRLRLDSQQLTAPSQLTEVPEMRGTRHGSARAALGDSAALPTQTGEPQTPLPLMRFQQPFHPEGID